MKRPVLYCFNSHFHSVISDIEAKVSGILPVFMASREI